MSLQLLSRINDRYHLALSVHREASDAFWFIGMQGYAMLHEHQYLSESCTQRKLKHYITSTYHTFMPDKLPKTANITEPLLSGKNRKNLKMEDSYKLIKELWQIYLDWEEETLHEYQKIAAEILASGEVSTFNFVSDEIIKDVKAELVFITDKVIELEAMGWDLPQIIAEQPDYFERYDRLIHELLGKSKMYHHHNSALDAQSRVFFKKAPEN